jgi:hypothetical protein
MRFHQIIVTTGWLALSFIAVGAMAENESPLLRGWVWPWRSIVLIALAVAVAAWLEMEYATTDHFVHSLLLMTMGSTDN